VRVTSYLWPVMDCKSCGVNNNTSSCASDISAVVFLCIVNDNLYIGK
jgi:hypothetical protein